MRWMTRLRMWWCGRKGLGVSDAERRVHENAKSLEARMGKPLDWQNRPRLVEKDEEVDWEAWESGWEKKEGGRSVERLPVMVKRNRR